MEEIYLEPMTDKLFHQYYKGFQNDPAIYMDESLFHPFQYDFDWVERYIRRQKEKKRLAFAIMKKRFACRRTPAEGY